MFSRNKEFPIAGITGDEKNILIPNADSSYTVTSTDILISEPNENRWRLANKKDTIDQYWKNLLDASIILNKHHNRVLIRPKGNRTAALYNITGELIFNFSGVGHTARFIDFSVDGNYIIAFTYEKKLKIYDLEATEIHSVDIHDHYDTVTISPSGNHVIILGLDKKLRIYNLRTNELIFLEENDNYEKIRIAPNGELIAAFIQKSTQNILYRDGFGYPDYQYQNKIKLWNINWICNPRI